MVSLPLPTVPVRIAPTRSVNRIKIESVNGISFGGKGTSAFGEEEFPESFREGGEGRVTPFLTNDDIGDSGNNGCNVDIDTAATPTACAADPFLLEF